MLSSSRMSEAVSLVPAISDDDLPLQRVYRWEKERPRAVFLTQPINGQTRVWTWAQTMGEARRMAAWLEAQGWPKESRIAILSKNCVWWVMAELAIWMAGHVTVPIYASLSAQSVRAQYWARDIDEACHILLRHYEHTYVAPGERFPRWTATTDPIDRDVQLYPHGDGGEDGFARRGRDLLGQDQSRPQETLRHSPGDDGGVRSGPSAA